MSEPTSRPWRPWAVASALIGGAMLVAYLSIMASEGNNSFGDVLPWAILMAAALAFAITSAAASNLRIARWASLGAVVLYAGIGLISLLTIGIGFLLAAGTALIGWTQIGAIPTPVGTDLGPPS